MFLVSEDADTFVRDDEAVCKLTNLTYLAAMPTCPYVIEHEADGSGLCYSPSTIREAAERIVEESRTLGAWFGAAV